GFSSRPRCMNTKIETFFTSIKNEGLIGKLRQEVHEPRLRGLPGGLLDQPFYGWVAMSS
ncbi:MAG: hypothetical protein QOI77_3427, partial [Blastocatellia bacterium]|nr:hypothetical protein [Blastocatellia bacterium]